MFSYTIERPLSVGASAFDLLQYKITALENAKARATETANTKAARLDVMHARFESKETPRRERFRLETDIEVEKAAYFRDVDKVRAIENELKGFRKALDLIITLSNSGGVLNETNKNHISNILNY